VFVRRLLEKQGHQVAVARDGRAVLTALEEAVFDLVLMDVQMPVMDGLEATRRIRARERATAAHMPIIAMTAGAMKGDREICLEAGMDEYLTKPVVLGELFAAIGTVAGAGAISPASRTWADSEIRA
jgi:two-component system sensor histidine kinase/response regulator